MKLSHRFAALFALIVAGFAVYGFWSFRTLNELKVNGPTYQRIVQGKDLIADILPPPEDIIESYLVSLQAISASGPERKVLLADLDRLRADYATRRAYWTREALEPAIRQQMDLAHQPAQEFFQIAVTQFRPALEQDDAAGAASALALMTQRYAIHRAAINRTVELATVRNTADEAAARSAIASSSSIMFAILVSVVVLAATMLTLLARSLIRQLGGEPAYATAIAGQIAAGNLAAHIEVKGSDQTSMLFAMRAMRDSLATIVSEVRSGTDTMSTASSQIAAGNLDLSSRTEQQASSLEETASSMQELTAAVRNNGANSREAQRLAESASLVAQQGGEMVARVVDTMGSINASSQKIADIIGVIDGIAFQTNILALNAAVEAARAGEQGRGFAVVASEVRNLAQRSASAAKEIKVLIGASVDTVAEGSKLVRQAGATMGDIVTSVKRVTDIMSDITAASGHQEEGIGQISQAIQEIDTVTQQNAALVEEAAAAAASLEDQATKLLQVVSVFQLGATPDASTSRPRTALGRQPGRLAIAA